MDRLLIHINMTCDFPYIGDNCTTTYAEYIGKPYYIYHGVFIGLTISAFMFALIQTCRSFYHSRLYQYKMKKMILIESLLMTIFLLIQSIDPLAYSGILNPLVESFASNLTTYVGLVILFTLIISTANVFKGIYTYKSITSIFKFNFWNIINFITFCLTITFSVLQVYTNRSLIRGIKLISIGLTTILATVKINDLLRSVVESFDRLNNVDGSQRIRSFVFGLNIFSFFVSVYQIVVGIISLTRGSHYHPNITADQIIFPMCEFIGVVLAVSFMSNIKYSEERLFDMPNINFPLIMIPKINWEYFECCKRGYWSDMKCIKYCKNCKRNNEEFNVTDNPI